jgi:hypothetical protein
MCSFDISVRLVKMENRKELKEGIASTNISNVTGNSTKPA